MPSSRAQLRNWWPQYDQNRDTVQYKRFSTGTISIHGLDDNDVLHLNVQQVKENGVAGLQRGSGPEYYQKMSGITRPEISQTQES